jgi:hypothetical protein
MALWITPRLQCLLCEEFTLSRAELATDAGSAETSAKMIVENVLRTRERAHALNYGGAIV